MAIFKRQAAASVSRQYRPCHQKTAQSSPFGNLCESRGSNQGNWTGMYQGQIQFDKAGRLLVMTCARAARGWQWTQRASTSLGFLTPPPTPQPLGTWGSVATWCSYLHQELGWWWQNGPPASLGAITSYRDTEKLQDWATETSWIEAWRSAPGAGLIPRWHPSCSQQDFDQVTPSSPPGQRVCHSKCSHSICVWKKKIGQTLETYYLFLARIYFLTDIYKH